MLRSDSQLAIYQLDGTYAVRSPSMRPLWDEACRLGGRLADLRFEWVRRTQNREADALTRKAYRQAVAACKRGPVRDLDDRSTTELVPAPPS